MRQTPGVTVGRLLQTHPETLGLDLEILTGSGGLDRRITSPYVQNTGPALAGFHQYLRPGCVLVFGNREVRYLECLQPADRTDTMRKVCEHDVPCILVTGGLGVFGETVFEAERCHLPVIRPQILTLVAIDTVPASRGHHAARQLAVRLEHQLQLAGIDQLEEPEIEEIADTGEEP